MGLAVEAAEGFAASGLPEREAAALNRLRQHGRSGRPLGSARFVARLETELGRRIGSGRRGRPPKAESE